MTVEHVSVPISFPSRTMLQLTRILIDNQTHNGIESPQRVAHPQNLVDCDVFSSFDYFDQRSQQHVISKLYKNLN